LIVDKGLKAWNRNWREFGKSKPTHSREICI
jgi:hypothetical protein